MNASLPPTWRRALPGFVVLFAAVLLLFGRTGLAMVEIWARSETFAHAFVVPPISLWLIWRQRHLLALHSPRPAPLALLPLALCALMWLMGDLVAVNSATQLAYVAMLVLCVPLALGWPVTRSIAFPLGFLFFAVPLGEFMTPHMMIWTADFTVMALQASGVPVYREGLHFIIPSGSWSVIEACSGIRYLIASVMVGTLFAYLNYRSMKRRLIFIVVAFLLPIVANWLRAYMIVMIGNLSGNRLAVGFDHIIYGWIFFGVVMMALFMIGMRWSEPDAALPAASSIPSRTYGGAGAIVTLALGLALIVLPATLIKHFDAPGDASFALSAPNLSATDWQVAPTPDVGYTPHFESPRAVLKTAFAKGGSNAVGVYVAYYRQQTYDSKLISSNNVLVQANNKVWAQTTNGSQPEPLLGSVLTADLRSADLRDDSGQGRLRAWEVYWVGGRLLTSDWQAKIWGALDRLTGRGDDAAVLVLYTKGSSASGADALLTDFAHDNAALLTAWLSGVAHGGVSPAGRQ